MTANDRTRPITSAYQLTQGLSDLAGTSRTDYRLDILQQVARTRQRPAWTFPERWLPMALIARPATAPPLRRTWNMLLIALVTMALVAAVAIAGALLLQRTPSDQNLAILVPTVDLDERWDPTKIPGLSRPSGLDVGPDGNLYVANAGADEMIVLSPDGEVLRRWGERGTGQGQFIFQGDTQDPTHRFGGVAIAPDGSVNVMDTGNDRVQQFDAEGTFIREFGGHGVGDGQLILAADLGTGPDGSVFVVDTGRGDIQHFSSDGAFIGKIGEQGTDDGQLHSDTGGIFVDDSGAVYNADASANRVQSWAPDGTFRWTLGTTGPTPARLFYPWDVAVDDRGGIYVTEPARMVMYTPDRALASTWPIPGADPTDGWNAIALADDGTIYMSVWHQDVIHRLRIVEREQDVTLAVDPDGSPPPAGTPEAVSPSAPEVHPQSIGSPFAVPFTVNLPDDWSMFEADNTTGYASVAKLKENSTYLSYAVVRVFVPTNAYADPCRSDAGPMSPPVGPSVDDLTAVLSSQPGFHLMQPVADITIDGFHGKTFELESSLIQSECDDGTWFPQFTYDDRGTQEFSGPGGNFHQRIAILDVDGTRVLVESWTFVDTSFVDLVAADEVFESIDFE